jgi:radical SAM enzyme (TIGR01210 family)
MILPLQPASPYPPLASQRNRWITELRRPPNPLNSRVPYAFISEQEPDADGAIVTISTIFLTNRQCPWKCVMCDLWQNALPESVPPGAIPAQIDHALAELPPAKHIKLYNAGSFFDPRAIPASDYEAIADRLRPFDRVIVESHPALIAGRCLEFLNLLESKLEIAIGLETAHPEALERLNKGMTIEQFTDAARFLVENDIALRVFLLVHPPFIDSAHAQDCIQRSIEFAFESSATAVSLIPTRTGNGAMEALQTAGDFVPPTLLDLERSLEYGLSLKRGRVFADLWDLQRFSNCPTCFGPRRSRLEQMNLHQSLLPAIPCGACGCATGGQ